MPATRIRILHVEDVPADAELAERELRQAGFEFDIRRVETREAFLAALADFTPDLILSDYRLPEFDGMQALRLAREHAPDVPVIITTGSVNEETAVACMKAGAADYVLKEHLGHLGTAVESTLERQQLAVDHRHTMESLNASQKALRALLDSSPDATLLLDSDGTVISCNRAVANEFGKSIREIVRRCIFDFMPTDVAAARRKQVEEARVTGRTVRYREEAPGRIHDVILVPIEGEGGSMAQVAVFARDVTDLERARADLARSELYFRSIIENSLDVTVVLALDAGFRYVSPAMERLFGYRPEELQGSRAFDFIHPEDRPLVEDSFRRALEDGTRVEQMEFRFRHRDGSWRTISAMGKALPPETGVQGAIINARDVTERRQLEALLVQAQKMEAVGRLAGGVAHDFNNLLTVIQGYAELLGASLANDPERSESLGEIVRAAERAAALTRQLLAFSRRQVLETRVLDLGAVVADTEKMLRRLIGEDVEVVVVKPATLGHVKADPGQIEQVLLNLAVNSRDAMPGGGRLTVELADVTLDAPFTTSHDSIPSGRYVVVSVRDTGSGMDAETLSHLFEPFFTTKEKGKGTGLGLATVFGIVKQSGGYVDVASAPGAGTTIRVYLPRTDARTTSGVRPRVSSRSGSETVLVVEDEAAVRNLVRAVLERKGYVVLAAQDGAGALELVDKHAGVIHVLLTDLVMPGMNGRDLAARVSARRPTIKVVFMSGYTADVPTDLGTEGGPAFLSKPFNERALTVKLREVLDTPPA
jgi:PAS domain S-box-containing protein